MSSGAAPLVPPAMRPTRTLSPTTTSEMLARHRHRFTRIAQADVDAFADHDVLREGEDAGKRRCLR